MSTGELQMESTDLPIPTTPRPIPVPRRFSRPRPPAERCDLCAIGLPPVHQHLLEPTARQVMCACDPCAILFSGSHGQKYKRIPRRIEHWSDFRLTDEQWAGLGVPISLAFFFRSTPHDQVIAMYPSPAGPTEAMLPAEVWQGLLDDNAALADLEPDVEALLVNRTLGTRDYYRAPIDECFKLVGLIRMHWRSLSGGTEVWKHIAAYFDDLKTRSAATSAHA